jgi:hypothetical protein
MTDSTMPPRTRRHRSRRGLALAVCATTALAGCGSDDNPPAADPSSTVVQQPVATSPVTSAAVPAGRPTADDPCGRSVDPPATYEHVVIIVEENRTWTGGRSSAVGMGFSGGDMPFLEQLATQCSYFVDWLEMDPIQNSLNQYIGLTSGVKSATVGNDCEPSATCMSTDDNIFRQVRESGGSARTYVDGATEPCSVGDNRAKHIPALYYRGGDDPSHCLDEVRPMSDFDPQELPTFAFVVPDLCHDGHDCGDDVVDDWAWSKIEPILDSEPYGRGQVLVVVIYDEDQPVPNLLIAPTATPGAIDDVVGSHASLMKTVELVLGLPVLDQGELPDAPSLRSSANI